MLELGWYTILLKGKSNALGRFLLLQLIPGKYCNKSSAMKDQGRGASENENLSGIAAFVC